MLPGVSGAQRLAVALASAALVSGCSVGGDEEPKAARGAPREVAAVVTELDRATRARDFAAVCNELFTPSARERAGGDDCARLLRSSARDVRRPKIEIAGIVVRGDRATVKVRSSAQGQPPLGDELELVRQGGRYRIESLR